ncbi:DedA family protein [Acinetobacter sp. ANC 5054]|uniref:DedA family protein n=1 Tax=Acinetobacter sp. ANC 5054 TaxID=1977877 RepID=UPI001D17453C|nr:DedA family protein [Acinetobacter sp. ANC 5054]
MNWADLIQHYGYIAIFIGTLFEGETVLMLGAYAVHQHLMNFPILIAVAMLGGFIGDQFYFQLGRRYGTQLIQSNADYAQKFERASQFIERYPILTILFMRFAWGLRTVLPISIGIRKYPVWKYVLINILACFIWAMVVATLGFQMSHYLHLFWEKLLPYHQDIYIVIAVISCIVLFKVGYVLLKWWRKNSKPHL